jgi:hypothetical protein
MRRLRVLIAVIATATVVLPVSEALSAVSFRLPLNGVRVRGVQPGTFKVPTQPQAGPTLVSDVRVGLQSADSPSVAAGPIVRLDTSPSAADQILAEAACEGFTSLANTEQLPDGQAWTQFLIGRVAQRLKAFGYAYHYLYLKTKVDQLTATSNLAFKYNPQIARQYAYACWLAGSRVR